MVPSNLLVSLDLVNSIGHELFVFTVVLDPMQRHTAIKPAACNCMTGNLASAFLALQMQLVAMCVDMSLARRANLLLQVFH